MTPYTPPTFSSTSFNCPHCNAYAQQEWEHLRWYKNEYTLWQATCSHCNNYSVWNDGLMIYPVVSSAPMPNDDLSADVQVDYLEARNIASQSPRGAAALLRLCIQKICIELGEKGKDLNIDIGNLVKKGLPAQIQKALDVVRVIGNNAVHPGIVDLRDNQEIANKLFNLVNSICTAMITQPKELEEMYGALPEKAIEQINMRDTKTE